MKFAKKLLVTMLALALLASAFIFSATATDQFNVPGLNDIEDILEYYTLEDYLADNYDDGTWTESLVETDGDYDLQKYPDRQLIDVSVKEDPTNSDNSVLGVKLPYNKKSGYRMAADDKAVGLTDKLFLTFKIYFDESAVDDLFYELKVGMVNERGDVSSSEFTILQFNFSKNQNNGVPGFYYSTWNPNAQSFNSERAAVADVAPETGMWYDVVISINAEDDVYSFDINDLEGNSIASSGELSLEGAEAMWGFYCYGRYQNTKDRDTTDAATFYIDDMEIYEGSYRRYPSRKAEYTTTHLQDLDALYNASADDFATKLRIAEVLSYLYDEAEDFTVGSAMPNARKYINETYAQALSNVVSKIDASIAYNDRVAYLDNIAFYNDKLPAPDVLNSADGITAELEATVITARAAYEQECAALATIKEHSDAFIALMGGYDDANKEYAYVTELFAEACDATKYASRDVTYAGVVEANEIFEVLKFKAERMESDVVTFTTAVGKMEAATTFGPLFTAYVDANTIYTKYGDAVINPDLDLSTVEGLTEDVAFYESKVDFVLEKAANCDDFNRIINEATISSYYTSLIGELEEAAIAREKFGDYEMDYPGLADSVATYEALIAAVQGHKNAVDAYVAAVNNIATKTTFAEKKAAVTAALALKADGDVLGIEGVVEANIALTNAEAEIGFLEASSNTLISLVEQLKAATTLSERRALIHLANASLPNAEDTYNGVSAAKADLASEIAEFEADVAAANAQLENAIKSAQSIVSSVDGSAIFVAGN